MWSTIATIALKILGAFISKRANDAEAERKFLELAQHLQGRKLISAKIKWNRKDNLDELAAKREQARNPNEQEKQ